VTTATTTQRPVLSTTDRWLALAGIAGVGGFVGAWVGLGATRDGYSPVDDAISRLAEDGAATQPWMTLGFVAFGVGIPLYAMALRKALAGPAWISATITGLAIFGVAVFPLGVADEAHGAFAGLGYITLAATPLLAARTFRSQGHQRWAIGSLVAGVASAVLLTASIGEPLHGAFQRAGLAATDVWIVATAWTIWRSGRLPG